MSTIKMKQIRYYSFKNAFAPSEIFLPRFNSKARCCGLMEDLDE